MGSRRRRTAASRRRETIHAAAYATTRLAAAHAGGLQQESRAAILRASGGARVAELPTAARGTAGPWATCQARGITQCREAATSAHQRGWQGSEAATTRSAIQSESKSLPKCRSKWDEDASRPNLSKSEGPCRIVFASVLCCPPQAARPPLSFRRGGGLHSERGARGYGGFNHIFMTQRGHELVRLGSPSAAPQ